MHPVFKISRSLPTLCALLFSCYIHTQRLIERQIDCIGVKTKKANFLYGDIVHSQFLSLD